MERERDCCASYYDGHSFHHPDQPDSSPPSYTEAAAQTHAEAAAVEADTGAQSAAPGAHHAGSRSSGAEYAEPVVCRVASYDGPVIGRVSCIPSARLLAF